MLLSRRDPRTAFCVCLPADLTASPEEPMKYSFAGALASVLLLGIAAEAIADPITITVDRRIVFAAAPRRVVVEDQRADALVATATPSAGEGVGMSTAELT